MVGVPDPAPAPLPLGLKRSLFPIRHPPLPPTIPTPAGRGAAGPQREGRHRPLREARRVCASASCPFNAVDNPANSHLKEKTLSQISRRDEAHEKDIMPQNPQKKRRSGERRDRG